MERNSLFIGPIQNINVLSESAHKYRIKYLMDHRYDSMNSQEKEEFLNKLTNKEAMLDFYETQTGNTLIYPESQLIEHKRGLYVSSNGTSNGILEKALILTSFTNAKTGGCLIVGIDKDLQILGIEDELMKRDESRELCECRLRNQLGQITSHNYVRKCQFSWLCIEKRETKHLLLRIDPPASYSDVALVSGSIVTLRVGSSTRRLQGQDLLNYFKEFYN